MTEWVLAYNPESPKVHVIIYWNWDDNLNTKIEVYISIERAKKRYIELFNTMKDVEENFVRLEEREIL